MKLSAPLNSQIALGLVELHVTSNGEGTVSLSDEGAVVLAHSGLAEVEELQALGFIDWELTFEA